MVQRIAEPGEDIEILRTHDADHSQQDNSGTQQPFSAAFCEPAQKVRVLPEPEAEENQESEQKADRGGAGVVQCRDFQPQIADADVPDTEKSQPESHEAESPFRGELLLPESFDGGPDQEEHQHEEPAPHAVAEAVEEFSGHREERRDEEDPGHDGSGASPADVLYREGQNHHTQNRHIQVGVVGAGSGDGRERQQPVQIGLQRVHDGMRLVGGARGCVGQRQHHGEGEDGGD